MQRLRNGEIGRRSVTICFATHGEEGSIERLTAGFEVVNLACEQTCAKGDKNGTELFVKRLFGKATKHELRHDKPDALFGQVAPDAVKVAQQSLVAGRRAAMAAIRDT